MERMERLHPETRATLRSLIKLHGADKLIAEIRELAAYKTRTVHYRKPYIRHGVQVAGAWCGGVNGHGRD
jgi:hypothetical protein